MSEMDLPPASPPKSVRLSKGGTDVGDAIALATAWLREDLDTWQHLASDAARSGPAGALAQLSQIVAELAEAIATSQFLGDTAEAVLQYLALDAERDDGDGPESL